MKEDSTGKANTCPLTRDKSQVQWTQNPDERP